MDTRKNPTIATGSEQPASNTTGASREVYVKPTLSRKDVFRTVTLFSGTQNIVGNG
jgi:hypothetical protein